jgi:hypothetical protein
LVDAYLQKVVMAKVSRGRTLVIVSAFLLSSLVGMPAALAANTAEPQLRLVAAAPSVTVPRYAGSSWLYLDVGANVVAGRTALEIRASRRSYHDPVVATQVITAGGVRKSRVLPAGLVTDFSGLSKFLHVALVDAAGQKVLDTDQGFCPNVYDAVRVRPDAPDRSPYPYGCSQMPFTLGSVWGIQAGWAVNTAQPVPAASLTVPDGTYTAHLTINEAHRVAFGIAPDQASASVQVTVKTYTGGGLPSAQQRAAAAPGVAPAPNNARPTGKAGAPTGPRPDLRALPAWQIHVDDGQPRDHGDGTPAVADEPKREYLSFAANVWNAGPSPLVVDGYREPGAGKMDAFQYFYDASGKQVGWEPAGTMEWDPRAGHTHWHFTDFARYRLLTADKQQAVRSQKEAFCLAPTDGIDLTVKQANWRPGNADLHTACGRESSLAIRETLDTGWGDTYTQRVPGQSFEITDLPNGTYYIEVAANPENRLRESNTGNNVSLRQVILGGTPGARTVEVPPYEGIDAP